MGYVNYFSQFDGKLAKFVLFVNNNSDVPHRNTTRVSYWVTNFMFLG